MSLAELPTPRPNWLTRLRARPVKDGAPSRRMSRRMATIWSLLAGFVAMWISAAIVFGLPGFYLPALALVPLCFLLLVIYAWG